MVKIALHPLLKFAAGYEILLADLDLREAISGYDLISLALTASEKCLNVLRFKILFHILTPFINYSPSPRWSIISAMSSSCSLIT